MTLGVLALLYKSTPVSRYECGGYLLSLTSATWIFRCSRCRSCAIQMCVQCLKVISVECFLCVADGSRNGNCGRAATVEHCVMRLQIELWKTLLENVQLMS